MESKAINIQKKIHQAVAFHQSGRLREAERLYTQLLRIQPANADLLHLLGVLRHQSGNSDSAIELITRAVSIDPNQALFHNDLGIVLAEAGQNERAFQAFSRATQLNPRYAEAYNNIGNILKEKGELDQALRSYNQALQMNPQYAEAYNNRGTIYFELGQIEQAMDDYDQALKLRPGYAEAYNNMGIAYQFQNRLEQALTAFNQALRLKPDYGDAHWNRSLVLLLQGKLLQAWPEFEWRWQKKEFAQIKKNFLQPTWNGQPFPGKTLLIYTEQGVGDTIQFIRYIPMVKKKGGKIILQCEVPLQTLFSHISGIDQIVPKDELPPEDFHYQIPLLSLPLLFQTSLETIPGEVPYLSVPSSSLPLPQGGGRKKVGFVWAGNPRHKNDRNRSIPLEFFQNLLDLESIQFYSLQVGERRHDLKGIGSSGSIVDLSHQLIDFYHTAVFIDQLDLVISVDTAVAHLAGALAKPVWTLLPFAPDWRWMLKREDTLWYPTMRLFRQPAPGDWHSVFLRVKQELRHFCQQ